MSQVSFRPVGAIKRRGGLAAFLLLAPGLFYLTLFFLTPLVSLIITSLQTPADSGAIGEYEFGLNIANYGYVITTYLPHILRSFGYALVATILALIISYPVAYYLAVRLRRRKLLQALLLTLLVAPFFISFLLRSFAWKQLLSSDGFVLQAFQFLGLLATDEVILGTAPAVIFSLTYNFIPFMALPIYANLERLDLKLVEASGDLYASPAQGFLRVTLPLSLPGIISGTLLTFIPAAGDFISASRNFFGSASTQMIGNVVEASYFRILDYPSAAALSVLLMLVIVILVVAYVRRSGTESLL